jgi:hypothetical protein
LQRPDGLGAQQPASCFLKGAAFSTGATTGAACWSWDPVTLQPMLQVMLRSGEALQPIARLDAVTYFNAVGAAANADRIAVVWREQDGGGQRATLQIIALDGTTLVGPLALAPRSLALAPPAIAMHANGHFASPPSRARSSSGMRRTARPASGPQGGRGPRAAHSGRRHRLRVSAPGAPDDAEEPSRRSVVVDTEVPVP